MTCTKPYASHTNAPTHTRSSLCHTLSTLYPLRSQLQKLEFATLWIILAHAAVFQTAPALSVLYAKVSILTRAAAYSVDIANAITKYNVTSTTSTNAVTLPLWLLLHHFGCLGAHLFSVFFLAPKTPAEIIVWALSSQSSHNTWTKKLSLVLYWGNVLAGALGGWAYACFLYHGGAGHAAALFVASVIMTCLGVLLLVTGSMSGSHFFVTLEAKQEVSKVKRKHVQIVCSQKVARAA